MNSQAIAILTPEQLKTLIKEAVRELEEEERAGLTAKPLTEEDLAKARKNLRRFGRAR